LVQRSQAEESFVSAEPVTCSTRLLQVKKTKMAMAPVQAGDNVGLLVDLIPESRLMAPTRLRRTTAGAALGNAASASMRKMPQRLRNQMDVLLSELRRAVSTYCTSAFKKCEKSPPSLVLARRARYRLRRPKHNRSAKSIASADGLLVVKTLAGVVIMASRRGHGRRTPKRLCLWL
jgi:hypothetical protein